MKINFNTNATRKENLDVELEPLTIKMDLYMLPGNDNIVISNVSNGTRISLDTIPDKSFKLNSLYMEDVLEWNDFICNDIEGFIAEKDKRCAEFPGIIYNYDGRFENMNNLNTISVEDYDRIKDLDHPSYTLYRRVFVDKNAMIRTANRITHTRSCYIGNYLSDKLEQYKYYDPVYIIDTIRKYDDIKINMIRFHVCSLQYFNPAMEDSVHLATQIEYKIPGSSYTYDIAGYYQYLPLLDRKRFEIETIERMKGEDRITVDCRFSKEWTGKTIIAPVAFNSVTIRKQHTFYDEKAYIVGFWDINWEEASEKNSDIISLDHVKNCTDQISNMVFSKFYEGQSVPMISDYPNSVQIVTGGTRLNLRFYTRTHGLGKKRYSSIHFKLDPVYKELTADIFGENIEEMDKERDFFIRRIYISYLKDVYAHINNESIILDSGIEIIDRDFYRTIKDNLENLRKRFNHTVHVFNIVVDDPEIQDYIRKYYLEDFDTVYKDYMVQIKEFDSIFMEYESLLLGNFVD